MVFFQEREDALFPTTAEDSEVKAQTQITGLDVKSQRKMKEQEEPAEEKSSSGSASMDVQSVTGNLK